jgi:hypothetical protein
MARFNEILVGRYNRFIQKLLSMKGPATMPQIAGEMQPVFPFFNGVENRYLEAWDRFGSGTALAASVGNVGGVRLRNPSASNVIAVIEKMAIQAGAGIIMNVNEGIVAADLANVAAIGRLDARGRTSTALSVTNQNSTAAIAGTSIFSIQIGAAQPYDVITFEDQEIPLLPGDAVTIVANTVNVAISVGLFWRERALEESERA